MRYQRGSPHDSLCRECQQKSFRILSAWGSLEFQYRDSSKVVSYRALIADMLDKHNIPTRAVARSTFGVVNDHTMVCDRESDCDECHRGILRNLIDLHSRHIDDLLSLAASVDTYCTLHNGRSDPYHQLDKYHTNHSDTETCHRRQIDCKLGKYTFQSECHTFRNLSELFVLYHTRCRSTPPAAFY